MAPLEAPCSIVDMLRPTERLLAVRGHVMFDRRQSPDDSVGRGLAGDLYLTSDRLILLGRRDLVFDLEEIGEIGLAGDRLFVSTRDGTGLSIDADRPRLLRVEIGAARAAARR